MPHHEEPLVLTILSTIPKVPLLLRLYYKFLLYDQYQIIHLSVQLSIQDTGINFSLSCKHHEKYFFILITFKLIEIFAKRKLGL